MGLILLYLDPPVLISEPTVTTDSVSAITQTSATLHGSIVLVGGALCTERGFEINTVPYAPGTPAGVKKELGSFNTGSFSLTASDLTPGQLYYYRAYATNPGYTGYGEWLSFVALPATYTVEIDGVDRTQDVVFPSLQIEDIINDEVDSCSLVIDDRRGLGFPEEDDEIIITMNDATKGFAGLIVGINLSSVQKTGAIQATLTCVDYTRLLDGNLVHRTYEGMTDVEIVIDVVERYCAGLGITTNSLTGTPVEIEQISFNYLQPSQVFRRLAELTGKNWYIDADKDIHYFELLTNPAPFDITPTNNQYKDLTLAKDSSQIKNRVYVRGGTKLSDFTTYSTKGDGVARKFPLPDKPHDVTVEVDTGSGFVEQSVGIKNIDTSGFKWYLNFQEKYLEQDAGEAVLTDAHTVRLTYKYDIPILVAQENTASIMQHGQKEFAIFDKNIRTTQSARDRAIAELTDYANSIIEGTFTTYETGFRSGQYINIAHPGYDVDANYIVQKVSATSMGAGYYQYTISVASAKTMGIIKFLIELLESNKNVIELDDNEVVDELLTITDSLLSDSLTDSLIIDSAGPYATWCTDSLQSSPSTRAVWDLFQWG